MEQHLAFDQSDLKNLGRPLHFDIDIYCKAVEGMICADEIELAIKMIDNPPAWYRENPHPELVRMKKILMENLYDVYSYAWDPDEAGWDKASVMEQAGSAYTYPRLDLLCELVKGLTRVPWVCELSTSHGVMPLGLVKAGLRFTFYAKNLNAAALDKARAWLFESGIMWSEAPTLEQPTVFVFTEALEHSFREEDLLYAYNKLGIDFDHVLLSVPYGCLGGGLPYWRTRRLGHVRGYTKNEFLSLAQRFFPQRRWTMSVHNSLVLIGSK